MTPPRPSSPDTPLRIRRLRLREWSAFVELWGATFPDDDVQLTGWYLRHHCRDICLLGSGKRLLGFVVLYMPHHDPAVAWVEYIGVHPSHRRRGLGVRLLDDVERRAARSGCTRVELAAKAGNAGASHVYQC